MPLAMDLHLAGEGLRCHAPQSTTSSKPQDNASPENETVPSCLGNGTDIEHTPPLAIMSAMEEEQPHDGGQYDTMSQTQSIIIRPSSPPVSSPNGQSLQDNSLLQESPSNDRINASTVHDRPETSLPDMDKRHTSDSVGTEFTQSYDDHMTSDQVDDEVQFILSVARKKRRKGTRLDSRSEDNNQRSKALDGKYSGENMIQHTQQSESLNLQAACLEAVRSQNLTYKIPGMNNTGNGVSVQSMPVGVLRSPNSPPALPSCEKRNMGKRKDRDDESHNLPEGLPATITSATGRCYSHTGTPLLPHHQHLTQSLSVKPLIRTQYMLGTNPSVAGQSNDKTGGHTLLRNGQQPLQVHASSAQSPIYWPVQPNPYLNQVQRMLPPSTESLKRRPSLYRIPQWHGSPQERRMAPPTTSANWVRSPYQSPYSFKNVDLNDASQIPPNGPENDTRLPPGGVTHNSFLSGTVSTQPLSIQQPKAPSARVKNLHPNHPRNMLVDIAQTCQDNFPFALIAKRHNQPIQKVFDTFSAVIQLPLLRSAVDARRPGKLGSFRMKEFKAMKKDANQLQKEKASRKKGKNL